MELIPNLSNKEDGDRRVATIHFEELTDTDNVLQYIASLYNDTIEMDVTVDEDSALIPMIYDPVVTFNGKSALLGVLWRQFVGFMDEYITLLDNYHDVLQERQGAKDYGYSNAEEYRVGMDEALNQARELLPGLRTFISGEGGEDGELH
jgi:hypothetical protein